jgi:hypothetical protein
MRWRLEGGAYRVLMGNPGGGEDHFKDLGVDGRVMLKWILKEVGWEVMDYIDLAEVRDKWWTVVNMAMNLQVSENVGNFLTSWRTVSFTRKTLVHGVGQLVDQSVT